MCCHHLNYHHQQQYNNSKYWQTISAHCFCCCLFPRRLRCRLSALRALALLLTFDLAATLLYGLLAQILDLLLFLLRSALYFYDVPIGIYVIQRNNVLYTYTYICIWLYVIACLRILIYLPPATQRAYLVVLVLLFLWWRVCWHISAPTNSVFSLEICLSLSKRKYYNFLRWNFAQIPYKFVTSALNKCKFFVFVNKYLNFFFLIFVHFFFVKFPTESLHMRAHIVYSYPIHQKCSAYKDIYCALTIIRWNSYISIIYIRTACPPLPRVVTTTSLLHLRLAVKQIKSHEVLVACVILRVARYSVWAPPHFRCHL